MLKYKKGYLEHHVIWSSYEMLFHIDYKHIFDFSAIYRIIFWNFQDQNTHFNFYQFLHKPKRSYTRIGYTFGIVTTRSWLVLCRLYNINCSLLFFNVYCYSIIGIPLGMIIRMIPAGIQNNPLLSIWSQCVRSHLK